MPTLRSATQMKNTANDPYSRGRNFAGHASIRKWNVAPISSPIEVQYSIAPGTAMAQRATGAKGNARVKAKRKAKSRRR